MFPTTTLTWYDHRVLRGSKMGKSSPRRRFISLLEPPNPLWGCSEAFSSYSGVPPSSSRRASRLLGAGFLSLWLLAGLLTTAVCHAAVSTGSRRTSRASLVASSTPDLASLLVNTPFPRFTTPSPALTKELASGGLPPGPLDQAALTHVFDVATPPLPWAVQDCAAASGTDACQGYLRVWAITSSSTPGSTASPNGAALEGIEELIGVLMPNQADATRLAGTVFQKSSLPPGSSNLKSVPTPGSPGSRAFTYDSHAFGKVTHIAVAMVHVARFVAVLQVSIFHSGIAPVTAAELASFARNQTIRADRAFGLAVAPVATTSPAKSSSNLPLEAGGGAGAVVVIGLLAWLLTHRRSGPKLATLGSASGTTGGALFLGATPPGTNSFGAAGSNPNATPFASNASGASSLVGFPFNAASGVYQAAGSQAGQWGNGQPGTSSTQLGQTAGQTGGPIGGVAQSSGLLPSFGEVLGSAVKKSSSVSQTSSQAVQGPGIGQASIDLPAFQSVFKGGSEQPSTQTAQYAPGETSQPTSQSTQPSTPAGWYDDPYAPGSGRLRWWDGQQWTQHVHPQG
jgi:hypothetical protein